MVTSDRADAVFKALADPTRREILELLRRRRRPVVEIADGFPMSRPAISKHLRLLREAGLVEEAREGRMRLYRAVVGALAPAAAWLSDQLEGEEPGPEVAARETVRRVEEAPEPEEPETAREPPEEDWRSW